MAAVVDKILSRLLGRKAKTSFNIAAEIAAQEAAIDAARTTIEAARSARQSAIEDFDAAGHKLADDNIAEAGREIERREHAIEALKAAHSARLDVEAREAFRTEVATLAQESADLRGRLKTEYSPAAQTIAACVASLAAFHAQRDKLIARGKDLGEPVDIAHPEDFRGAPLKKQWSAYWPAPEGGYSTCGPVEDAPKGSIEWVNGEPVSRRKDVTIETPRIVSGGQPASLVEAVGDLPKLGVGEGYFHHGWKFVMPERVPLAERLLMPR